MRTMASEPSWTCARSWLTFGRAHVWLGVRRLHSPLFNSAFYVSHVATIPEQVQNTVFPCTYGNNYSHPFTTLYA
jgi:hypothetical protein